MLAQSNSAQSFVDDFMFFRYQCIFLFLLLWCPPAWGEIILSVDAEEASIRRRPDRKDNYLTKTVDGDLIDNNLVLEGQVQGYSRPPSISATEYRQGSHSLMFQVRPNSRGKERTEYWFEGSRTRPKPYDPTFTDGTNTSVIPWGEERYTGFSFKLPANYQVGHGNFITQFWQRSPNGPPVSLQIYRKDGSLKGTIAVINDRGTRIVDRFLIKRGVWHDVIFHYRFSRNPKVGFFRTWVRPMTQKQYRSLKTYRGAIGFADRNQADRAVRGIFHKFGIYRPAKDNKQHTVFIDEVRNARPSPKVFYEIDPSRVNPSQFYSLKNVAANSVLSSSGNRNHNALLSTNPQRQGWRFIEVGRGYYQLVHNSGKVLEAHQGDNRAWDRGDRVRLANRTNQPSQQWFLLNRGKGNYQLVNRASRFVLAGNWGRNRVWNNGDAVYLEAAGISSSQLWRFGR